MQVLPNFSTAAGIIELLVTFLCHSVTVTQANGL
ncbi:MAG: hypothetical protein ACI9OO_002021 [Bacteroidia bacterium]|jgi:hypothetical protein